ncbi:MAG: Na/Pi cotransporter family protein [Firmicutes bacterium]|jgi:phosphate:Na+ symporter|nr:Na/Pi cotransporter family protein [Bacillota bacterium]
MSYLDIIIPFVGGLALFIYGMQIMAQGLQNAAGNKMKQLLKALTQNKIMGVLLGAIVTAIIQSSSATTIMVVGFVNAGLMDLTQSMSVIMGANIGTTVTGWLVSSVEWAKFLSPAVIAPVVVMIGVILMITAKNISHKEISSIIIGFGILFIGIEMMSDAVYPLRESEIFKTLFMTLGENPILGILTGAAVTAIIQSSSASVGILQTLAASGLVPFHAAVYIIMGQNIGTCITAMLSAIGASRNAKCASYMHLLFNIIGTVLFSIVSIAYFKIINPTMGFGPISQTEISVVHTVFNIATTILLFPFSSYIINIAKKLNHVEMEQEKDESELVHLDDRLLETPSFAVQSAVLEVVRMGYIVEKNLNTAVAALLERNHDKIDKVRKREVTINNLCNSISDYLVKICNTHINQTENSVVTSLLAVITDMERIGDHCKNLAGCAEALERDNVFFSESAVEELLQMIDKTKSSYDNALKALEFSDTTFAYETVRAEDIVDDMEEKLRAGHINRLANNLCNVRSGVRYLDTLTNLERISDHAMNIAQSVINENRKAQHFHEVTE